MRYLLTIDGDVPVVVDVAAVIDAWGRTAPLEAARIFDLQVGESAVLLESARVEARRTE